MIELQRSNTLIFAFLSFVHMFIQHKFTLTKRREEAATCGRICVQLAVFFEIRSLF